MEYTVKLAIVLNFIFLLQCNAYKIRTVSQPIQHAEGPYWCESTQTLLYADTFTSTLHRLKINPPSDLGSFVLPHHRSVGFAIEQKEKKNSYVLFADHDIYDIEWPLNKKAHFTRIRTVETKKPKNQFNEGKADNRGRLWAGTLTREANQSVSPKGGSLYMIDQDLKLHTRLTNISISNGLIWNKNYTKFYFIDSATFNVDQYDYEEKKGLISNKRVVINIRDAGFQGIADGMNIDENDNLWIALFGGHHVIQVNPKTGYIMKKIKMPATYITSVLWGGPNYDILFVLSSRLHLNATQLIAEPTAGCVFTITNLGVKGRRSNQAIIETS